MLPYLKISKAIEPGFAGGGETEPYNVIRSRLRNILVTYNFILLATLPGRAQPLMSMMLAAQSEKLLVVGAMPASYVVKSGASKLFSKMGRSASTILS